MLFFFFFFLNDQENNIAKLAIRTQHETPFI
jgi:hypothetical protein